MSDEQGALRVYAGLIRFSNPPNTLPSFPASHALRVRSCLPVCMPALLTIATLAKLVGQNQTRDITSVATRDTDATSSDACA